MGVEQAYRYVTPSTLGRDGLTLATTGGRGPHPHIFRGTVAHPDQVARALLAVAEVARTRYADPGAAARALDPVVTSNLSVLRFESFSGCNGVYARFDLDAAAFDADHLDWGTTNVDVHEPLRAALAGVLPGDRLGLRVGLDEVAVTVDDTEVVERRVPLPGRWVRGFAQVQLSSAAMVAVASLPAASARTVLRDLPSTRAGNRPFWIVLGPSGARVSNRPSGDAPSLVGPQRLASLRRVLPHVRGLTVYAEPPRARPRAASTGRGGEGLRASAWVVDLDVGGLTLVVSPELFRGFSGEGAVLDALVTGDRAAAGRVGERLAGQAQLHADDLAPVAGSRTAAIDALRVLGAAGRVGHDLRPDAHFHRDLPFDRRALDDQPRLRRARELVDASAVDLEVGGARVRSDEAEYHVRAAAAGSTCTCVWFAKHRGERGPCAHVLAERIARSRQVVDPEVGR